MADISIIMEVLGKEDMVKAAKLTDTLKNKMNFLAASLQKGKLTSSQYTAAVNQLASKNKTLAGGYQTLLGQLMAYNAKAIQQTNIVGQQVAAVTRLGNAQISMGAKTQVASRKMNSGSVAMQQFGYQAGDFLVQVQSGTSAMLAFGQQATQLVGVLPMVHKQLGLSVGAAVGLAAGLGIAIPLLTAIGGAFLRTRKKAKEAAGGVKTVEEALKNLSNSYKDAEASAASFQGVVEDFNARQVANGYVVLGEKVGETFGASLMDRALNSLRGFGPESAEMKAVEDNLQKAFGVYGKGAGDIFGAGFIDQLQDAISTENVQALEDIINSLDAFGNRNPMGDRFIQDLIAAVDLMKGYTSEVIKTADELREAVDLGEELSDLNLELGVEAAAAAAKLLAERLGVSLGAAQRMVGLATGQGVTGPDGAIGQMRGRFSDGLLRDSIVFQETYDSEDTTDPKKSGTGTTTIKETALEKLQKQLDLADELYGKTEEFMHVRKALGDEWATTSQSEIDRLMAQYKATEDLINLDQERASLATSIADSIGDGYTAMVEGTMSVKDAFKSMARDIIKQLWDVLVMQKLIGSVGVGGGEGATGIAGFIGGLLGFDGGGYTGSGARSGGMDGKGGFVAMLHPQETVVDHTKGQSSGGTTVQQTLNFNFSANGDDSVKKIIAQAAPQIAQMTQKSMMDQRRRGGSMKSTFG